MFAAGGGYLANIAPSELAQLYEEALPDAMTGRDFTAAYGRHWDAATQARLARCMLSEPACCPASRAPGGALPALPGLPDSRRRAGTLPASRRNTATHNDISPVSARRSCLVLHWDAGHAHGSDDTAMSGCVELGSWPCRLWPCSSCGSSDRWPFPRRARQRRCARAPATRCAWRPRTPSTRTGACGTSAACSPPGPAPTPASSWRCWASSCSRRALNSVRIG